MAEILRVYNEMFKPELDYCVICLRSERQRRLVSTDNLEKFIRSINLPFGYKRTFQKICWVCDRHATAAYKFRVAINMSASLHSLFFLLARSRRSYSDTAAQLTGSAPATGVVSSAEDCLAQLERIRTRTTLLSTEVLVVASVPPRVCTNANGGEASCPPQEASPPRREEYLLPHAPPPSPPRAPSPLPDTNDVENDQAEPEIFMDSFVIMDDEKDPIEIKREESTDDIIIEESNMAHSIQLNPTTLRPLTSNETLPRTSNILPKTSNTLLISTLPKTNIPQTTIPPNPVIVSQMPTKIVNLEQLLEGQTENTSFLLHPIVENNGIVSVPSLGAQIINGQLVTIDNSNIVIQTPRLALNNGISLNLLSDPTQVTNYLKSIDNNELSKISVISNTISTETMESNIQKMQQNNIPNHQLLSEILESQQVQSALSAANQDTQNLPNKSYSNNIITESIVVDDDDDDDAGNIKSTESSKRKRGNIVEEGPPVKQKETDWEDKIPMDVISYMDATDPNPIMEAPLGVIAHVETLAQAPVETNTLHDLLTRPGNKPKMCSVPSNSGQIISVQSNSGLINSRHSNTGQIISVQSNSGQIMSVQSNSGQTISGQSNSKQIFSGQSNTGQTISGQSNSGQIFSGQSNTGQKVVDYGPYSLFLKERETNVSDGVRGKRGRSKRVTSGSNRGDTTSRENVHINVFRIKDNNTVNSSDIIDLC